MSCSMLHSSTTSSSEEAQRRVPEHCLAVGGFVGAKLTLPAGDIAVTCPLLQGQPEEAQQCPMTLLLVHRGTQAWRRLHLSVLS